MSHHRFYIQPAEWNPEAFVLAGDEARHCAEVLRCREGDRITVFNGIGSEANVEITAMNGRTVELRPLGITKSEPLPARITLGQAVPKGKNMDLIVQKATELGAGCIAPLLSERTVVRLDEGEGGRKQEKWQRVALEACKQCGQNWIPEVNTPQSVERFLSKLAGAPPADELRLIAAIDSDAHPLKPILADFQEANGGNLPTRAVVLIGPEGDFTPAELAQARNAGFHPLSLGPIVLRSETAAFYALSILGHELLG